jgi:hypothetical protein
MLRLEQRWLKKMQKLSSKITLFWEDIARKMPFLRRRYFKF